MVRCAAILLAAGKSTRMGELKALLPWEGTTLFQHQLNQLRQSCVNTISIVLGYQSSKYLPYLKNIEANIVVNEDYEKGKTESIKKGVLSIDETFDCFIVASVDQPLNRFVIDGMVKHFKDTESKIIIPNFQEKRGHPLLLSSELREAVMQIKEETSGLKAILHKWKDEISELKVNDHSILFNFNSKSDYEKAFGKGKKHDANI